MRDLNIYTLWVNLSGQQHWVSQCPFLEGLTQWITEWVLLEIGNDCGLIHPVIRFRIPNMFLVFKLSQLVSKVEKVLLFKSSWLHAHHSFWLLTTCKHGGGRPHLHLSHEWCQLGRQRKEGSLTKRTLLNKHSLSWVMSSRFSTWQLQCSLQQENFKLNFTVGDPTCQHLEPM